MAHAFSSAACCRAVFLTCVYRYATAVCVPASFKRLSKFIAPCVMFAFKTKPNESVYFAIDSLRDL